MKKQMTEKLNKNKGITLIALVITIIVMLVLVAVTISMAVNGGLFNYAGRATGGTRNALNAEQELGNGKITIDNKVYNSIDEYLNGGATNPGTPEEPALPETDAKYFDFTFDEATQTATLTGIKEEYMVTLSYYDDYYYEEINEKGPAYIKDGENEIRDIVIPRKVVKDGITYTVTGIGEEAFYCKNIDSEITSITILNNVISIGNKAFYTCWNLANVTLGNNVTNIGSYAFAACNKLTNITIPNNVTVIGNGAFSQCYSLANITLPENITSIGYSVFSSCSKLTSVTIPNNVTSIGEMAFYGCKGLTSITIPKNVTSIGNSSFEQCSGLTSVTIPNNVKSIGERAFALCDGLTNIDILEDVTSIGSYAFYKCTELTSATIQGGAIENHAFDDCNKLKNLVIGENVTSIGDWAFKYSKVTKVVIPYNVEYMGFSVFADCVMLKDVYCERTQEEASEWNGEWNIDGIQYEMPFEIHWGSTGPEGE